MAKVRFRYDPETISYKNIEKTAKYHIRKIFSYISTGLVFAGIAVVILFTFYDSPREKMLKREISQYEFQMKVFNDKLEEFDKVLSDIEYRDDNIYRVIFEAEPINSDIRTGGYGGTNRFTKYDGFSYGTMLTDISTKMDVLSNRLYVQSTSLDAIYDLAKNKEEMLQSIPAIIPVRETDIRRLSSSFGYRTDPFYKVAKFHEGVDFSATVGKEVVSTGNGTVVTAKRNSPHGYGQYVVIDHGFGYSTMYAHLNDIKVKLGDKVNRGQLIGHIGNTGKSTGPHLHYEVRKNDKAVNPINYFFNDITPEEYEFLLELSEIPSQSMD